MDPDPSISDDLTENGPHKADVWVIEDDLAYQRLVVTMLEKIPEITCSFVSTQCELAIERIKSGKKPDVILMDISLKGDMDGIEGTWELKEMDNDLHVLALTNNDDEDAVSSMIMAGVSGYLLKSSTRAEIIKSIREVLKGGSPITPSIASTMMRLYRKHAKPKPLFVNNYRLSKRELEVLQYLAKGNTKREVASKTNISEHTVDTHIRSIYKKLDVRNRSAAIIKAVNEGLVSLN